MEEFSGRDALDAGLLGQRPGGRTPLNFAGGLLVRSSRKRRRPTRY